MVAGSNLVLCAVPASGIQVRKVLVAVVAGHFVSFPVVRRLHVEAFGIDCPTRAHSENRPVGRHSRSQSNVRSLLKHRFGVKDLLLDGSLGRPDFVAWRKWADHPITDR